MNGKLGVRAAACSGPALCPRAAGLPEMGHLLACRTGRQEERKYLHRGSAVAVLRGREMKGRHVVSQSCWNRWPGRHQPELCAQSRSPHKVRAVSLQPVEEMKGNNEAPALPFVN